MENDSIEEDSFIQELITDFLNTITKYNYNMKKFLDPMLCLLEEYVKIYLYLIYILIVLILIITTVNSFLIIRVHNKLFS